MATGACRLQAADQGEGQRQLMPCLWRGVSVSVIACDCWSPQERFHDLPAISVWEIPSRPQQRCARSISPSIAAQALHSFQSDRQWLARPRASRAGKPEKLREKPSKRRSISCCSAENGLDVRCVTTRSPATGIREFNVTDDLLYQNENLIGSARSHCVFRVSLRLGSIISPLARILL